MNITFQNITDQRAEKKPFINGMEAENRTGLSAGRTEKTGGSAYAVQLDSSLFSDDAYAKNAKSIDDISNMAENTDVLNRHNFMALLSNTMSGEDYAKALEDGFDLKNLNSAETVTIVDRIKSALLQAGVEVVGYNDDMSLDKLTKIFGNKGFASALKSSFSENDIPLTEENITDAKVAYEEVSQMENLDDSAVKYLVLNNKSATIGNVYLAQHSTNGQNASGRGFYAQDMGGYYAQKSDSYDWEQLRPQLEKVVNEAGLSAEDDHVIDMAKWTVMQGIPLTAENLERVIELKDISFPIKDEKLASVITSAIADGKSAVEGNIIDPTSNMSRAIELADKTAKLSDESVDKVLSQGKEVNLKNLFEAEYSSVSVNAAYYDTAASQTARLQLEEVRLKMTVEANKQLLDSGFSIDTAPMEQLIERLKGLLGQQADEAAGQAVDEHTHVSATSSKAIFEMSLSRISIIRTAPADLVGKMSSEFETATLGKISEEAAKLTMKFKAASQGYEELMTAPRADLGDSIKKAFRNVDDILQDLGKELNDENRRAVRILGYNIMEINEENFEKVRSWDQKLKSTIDRLKPGAVLDLIREGKNPLGMTIEELGKSLDENLMGGNKNSSGGNNKSDEKYAKFLYKLEKKGNITEAEKQSFIGIYRLFHTIKATDYQAIGSLLKTDQDMTLGNLLKATRTQKTSKRGLDFTVDDDFGGLSAGRSGIKIDEQINSAFRFYSAQADIVYENLEPEKLAKAAPKNETLLPDLANALSQAEIDKELERKYSDEQLKDIRETVASRLTESTLDEMDSLEMELTYNNLEAMIANRRDRKSGSIWEKTTDYDEKADEIQDKLTSLLGEEGYEEEYQKQVLSLRDQLSEEILNPENSFIDVRAIKLMQKQLSVMSGNAERGSFEIPVEVEGTKVSMHVTLRSDNSNITRMDASIQTYEYGLITASLYEKGGVINGMLTTTSAENAEESEYLEGIRQKMCDNLANMIKDIGVDQNMISILYHAQSKPTGVGTGIARAMDGGQNNNTDTTTLLKMAKAFIEAL